MLLAWDGEKYRTSTQLCCNFRVAQCKCCARKGGQLHMVATGVGHTGFRYRQWMFRAANAVQLADQTDGWTRCTHLCTHTGDSEASFRVQPTAMLQPVCNALCCAVFGIAQLGVRINIVGKCRQLGRMVIENAADACFDRVHGKIPPAVSQYTAREKRLQGANIAV